MIHFADERVQRLVDDLTTITLVNIAETLDGKAAPSRLVAGFAAERGVKTASSGEVVRRFLRHDGKLDTGAAVKMLLSRDPETGLALSRAEQARIKQLYRPGSGQNVLDRVDLAQHLAPMLAPPKPIKQGDLKAWNAHFAGLMKSATRSFPTPGSLGAPSGSVPGTPSHNFLKFMVREIICDDDTSESGKDEISIGGIGARGTITDEIPDPASHDVTAFPLVDAGQFRTGDRTTWPAPREMCSFNLNAGQMPQIYMAHLALAEVDNGGFADFLEDLHAAVLVELTAILTAVGAAIGAAIGAGAAAGGLAGTVAGPIGTLIGAAAGVVIAAVVAGVASLMRDDIFGVQTAPLILNDASETFGGSTTSPVETFTYVDFGGVYRVRYFWQLA